MRLFAFRWAGRSRLRRCGCRRLRARRAASTAGSTPLPHERRQARGGQATIAGLLPFAPTALRTFAPSDRVGALLRVHQPTRAAAADVVLDTEIVDGAGVIVHEAERLIAAEAFKSGTGVPHRFELPLADLAPGDYLLRFVATAGKSRIQRDVRFSVQPPIPGAILNPGPS